MKTVIPLFALSIAGIGAANAADHGIYLGAGLGQSKLDPDSRRLNFSELNYDDKDQGYKIIAGIRPLDVLGAELNYVDLGKTDGSGIGGAIRADAKLVNFSVVGYVPLPFVDLFGKAGFARSESRFREDGIGSLKDNSTDFSWGAGVQAHFGSLGARVEYERFNLPRTDRASLVSLGVTWTFL
ncbi:MAG: outer membrane beta-barrel protein [Steroidobacteraceae bacterium]